MLQLENSQLLYKIKKINGDTLTPIAVFNQLDGKKKFLLESSLKHEDNGRFSFIGMNPYRDYVANGDEVLISSDGKPMTKEKGPSLSILKKYLPRHETSFTFPFSGGAIGYIGYDAIRQYENIGAIIDDELQIPDVHLMFYQDVIVFDHRTQTLNLVSMNLDQNRTEEDLVQKIAEMETALFQIKYEFPQASEAVDFKPLMEKEKFLKMVEIAKEYIRKGDIFQVVLSQRMKGEINTDPFQYYRRLRNANPSPYMFYIDFEDYIVLGASPESLIKTKGNQLITNPIAGTRVRGRTNAEDEMLEKELLADEKELAEHKMLVDLSRNDVGRVCEPGTIAIPKYMNIERYQHVMHIVSEVQGTLRQNYTGVDALISCLPAGTVSGAPKIRAMQIINELERSKRGVYAGAVGYINVNGDVDFALAIRSLLIKEKVAYLQTGAGIVYDSQPENEYNETINKAKALLEVNKDDSTD